MRYRSYVSMAAVASCWWLAATSARAQSTDGLEVGETVRINGDFVGRVVAVDVPDLTVFGQGEPTCTAGIYHGEAAICSPAPMEQQTVDMTAVTVERAVTDAGRTRALLIGAVIGGVVGAGAGYAIGPVLGFGRLSTCVETNGLETCSSANTPPEVQRASDQWRGTAFLGFVGATVGGLLANALSDEWVTVRAAPGSGDDPAWGVALSLPVP